MKTVLRLVQDAVEAQEKVWGGPLGGGLPMLCVTAVRGRLLPCVSISLTCTSLTPLFPLPHMAMIPPHTLPTFITGCGPLLGRGRQGGTLPGRILGEPEGGYLPRVGLLRGGCTFQPYSADQGLPETSRTPRSLRPPLPLTP